VALQHVAAATILTPPAMAGARSAEHMQVFNRRRFLQTGMPLAAVLGAGACGKRIEASPAPLAVSAGAAAAAAPALATTAAPAAATGAAQTRLGINLAGIVDWNSELPFVDVFRQSREWISQRAGAGWGQGPKLALDAAGWVKALEPDCWAETPLCSVEGGHYPAGSYAVSYEGSGELEFWAGARIAQSAPGRLTVEVTPSKGPIWCRIKKTDPANPVRNIRVLRPGAEPGSTFHADFLNRWQGMACLRFMDWMATNGSKQSSWRDRPLASDASFAHKGVPVEVMVDLANTLQSPPWFCMPHLADDDYVRRFAELVKARLSPQLKVYVEYSNEVWNTQFQQTRHVHAEAGKLKLSPFGFVAKRSVEIFRIWEQVFGGKDRLVRVLPSQAANRHMSEQLLKQPDIQQSADVLAIAPYISFNVPPDGRGLIAGEVERWSLDTLFDYLESKSLPECIDWMKQQKAVADKAGLKLVAYEGGQHLTGVLGAENRDPLTRLLLAANADPRMGRLYERYFDAWSAVGGDLHCHFYSVGTWSKWGSWGLLQHALQDPKTAPKFMATMKWGQKLGQKLRLPG
jgi:hypothetical protein